MQAADKELQGQLQEMMVRMHRSCRRPLWVQTGTGLIAWPPAVGLLQAVSPAARAACEWKESAGTRDLAVML